MEIMFTKCWVGEYQGEGSYEGDTCPDVLITNVPEGITEEDLFSYYLMGLCHGYCDYDKIKYKSKVVKVRSTTKTPIKITSKYQLEDCYDSFIEVDYLDLLNWIDEYLD